MVDITLRGGGKILVENAANIDFDVSGDGLSAIGSARAVVRVLVGNLTSGGVSAFRDSHGRGGEGVGEVGVNSDSCGGDESDGCETLHGL